MGWEEAVKIQSSVCCHSCNSEVKRSDSSSLFHQKEQPNS